MPLRASSFEFTDKIIHKVKVEGLRNSIPNPLAGFTLQKVEDFDYADGILQTVSLGEWLHELGSNILVLNSRLNQQNLAGGEYIIDFTNPDYDLVNNISYAVKFFMRATSNIQVPFGATQTYTGGFSLDPPASGNARQVQMLTSDGLTYTLRRIFLGSNTQVHAFAADDLLHEVVMRFTVNEAETHHNTAIFLDGIEVNSVTDASLLTLDNLSMYMAAGASNSVGDPIDPQGVEQVSYYHVP